MPDDPSPGCREFQLIIAARDRSDLTGVEFAVFCALASHRLNFKPTVTQIAYGAKVCVRSAQRALSRLEELGMVAPVNAAKCGRGHQRRYVPVVPESATQGRTYAGSATQGRTYPGPEPESATLCPIKCDTESDSEKESEEDSIADAMEGDASPPSPALAPVVDLVTEKARRSTRWPAGQTVPDAWIDEGYDIRRNAGLPEINVELEAANFTDHWTAKAGKDACKRDWHATWRQWVRNSFQKSPRSAVGRPSTAMDKASRDLLDAVGNPDFDYRLGEIHHG